MNSPLAVAQAAYARWIADPNNANASRDYHRFVSRLVEWFDSLTETQRLELCGETGLTVELDLMEETGLHRFTPADNVPAHRLRRRHTRSGIGVPVVTWRPNEGSGQWDALRPPEGIAAPGTAILQRGAKGQGWTLCFLSPYRRETVTLEGRSYPLAANFTAPTAMIAWQAEPLRRSGFRGMLNSSAIPRREKLYLMQPYDPNRIPVLMVHGLQSTPVSFANLVNDLFADPVLHARYQIWHYHYPTGTPVLQNAAVLRRVLQQTLREIDPQGRDFATNNLVVLGHSMGGIMAHTLISDSGYKLWDSTISVRPETFSCDLKTRRVIDAIYVFERERRVRRAILIAVPHRGSSVADNWIGNLG
jgi:pimeloyl-ACP methyl ester carboxylesterase